MDLLIRFLAGGTAVCLFAAIGDVARPKSFAGVFSAAPSVALATLALTLRTSGATYTAIEARSMVVGAIAMLVYVYICRMGFWQARRSVKAIAVICLVAWLVIGVTGGVLLWRVNS